MEIPAEQVKAIEQAMNLQKIARQMVKSGMLEPTFQKALVSIVANPTILNIAMQYADVQKFWSSQQLAESTAAVKMLTRALGNLSVERIEQVASTAATTIEPFLGEESEEPINKGGLSAPIYVTVSFDVERIVTRTEQISCDVQRIVVNEPKSISPSGDNEIQDWLLLIGKDLRTTVKGTLAPLVTFFAALANMLNTRGQLEESNVAITVAAVFLLIALTNPQNK